MGIWNCGGCGTALSEGDPDVIVDHVQSCDYADGAGCPISVTLKFSAVHWYIATVDSGELAQAAARPFAQLTGPADGGGSFAGYLEGLISNGAACAGLDGIEVSDVYPAIRDQPALRNRLAAAAERSLGCFYCDQDITLPENGCWQAADGETACAESPDGGHTPDEIHDDGELDGGQDDMPVRVEFEITTRHVAEMPYQELIALAGNQFDVPDAEELADGHVYIVPAGNQTAGAELTAGLLEAKEYDDIGSHSAQITELRCA